MLAGRRRERLRYMWVINGLVISTVLHMQQSRGKWILVFKSKMIGPFGCAKWGVKFRLWLVSNYLSRLSWWKRKLVDFWVIALVTKAISVPLSSFLYSAEIVASYKICRDFQITTTRLELRVFPFCIRNTYLGNVIGCDRKGIFIQSKIAIK